MNCHKAQKGAINEVEPKRENKVRIDLTVSSLILD